MIVPNQNAVDRDDADIHSDIMEQIARTHECFAEGQQLTDNTKLENELQLLDVKKESLKQVLQTKNRELRELSEQLACKKADFGQHLNQRASNYDGRWLMVLMEVRVTSIHGILLNNRVFLFCVVVAEVFKDTKKFSAKAGAEISQTFTLLGFDIDYECVDDQAMIKVFVVALLLFVSLESRPRRSR